MVKTSNFEKPFLLFDSRVSGGQKSQGTEIFKNFEQFSTKPKVIEAWVGFQKIFELKLQLGFCALVWKLLTFVELHWQSFQLDPSDFATMIDRQKYQLVACYLFHHAQHMD